MLKENNNAKVAVVLRHHNAFDLTFECLSSLKNQEYKNLQFIIIDDYSTDGSIERLKMFFHNFTVLSTSRYVEYSVGLNMGIRHALKNGADYVFVVNNDTKSFSNDLIQKMVNEFQKDTSIGLVGCKVFDYDGSIRWGGTYKNKLGVEMRTPTEGYMISKETFNQVGLLDEKLVRYFEDLDFLIKLRNNNIKVAFTKSVSFKHLGNGTSSKQAFIPPYYRSRNLIWFLKTCCKEKRIIWKIKNYVIYTIATLSRMKYFVQYRLYHKLPVFVFAFICGSLVGLCTNWQQTRYD